MSESDWEKAKSRSVVPHGSWSWSGGRGGRETNDDEDENSEGGEGERRWETNDDEDEYSHGDGSDDGDDYGNGDDCPESLGSTYAITTPVFCRAPM